MRVYTKTTSNPKRTSHFSTNFMTEGYLCWITVELSTRRSTLHDWAFQLRLLAPGSLSAHALRNSYITCYILYRTETSDVQGNMNTMKKRSQRRKHCALAVVRQSQKLSLPPQTPLPGAQDSQNLISWRWSLPSPTDPVW